ncbi:hypothetical protein [Pandoraea sputorum]|uniref:hypothetical protein n=1 Tax=Pandoraea sputorum TaxID=93222 RepID=UPI00123F4FB3|nr:hypothetical protein [Pandoraea sputorum]
MAEQKVVKLVRAKTYDRAPPPVDKGREPPDHSDMNAPTREEFEAKLETIEARMDGRVARIEGKIDAFIAQSAERDKRIELLAVSAAKSAEQAATLKSNMWLAALTVVLAVIGTVVAAYFATQSSNIGIAQAVTAAFQQGQNSAQPTANAKPSK